MGVYAYVRVSTEKQDIQVQKSAILEWGEKNNIKIDNWIEDEAISGSMPPLKRPGFSTLWKLLKKGDTLVVFDLSRLGRSLRDIVFIASELRERGVKLISLKEGLDPKANELQYTITIGVLGLLAEIERQLIRERTKAGLMRARERGKKIGRPPKVDRQKLIKLLKRGLRPREIAEILGVSVRTVYSNIDRLRKAGVVEREERWIVKV